MKLAHILLFLVASAAILAEPSTGRGASPTVDTDDVIAGVEARVASLRRVKLLVEARRVAFLESAVERVASRPTAEHTREEMAITEVLLDSFAGRLTLAFDRDRMDWAVHKQPTSTLGEFLESEKLSLSSDSGLFSMARSTFESESWFINNQAMYATYGPETQTLAFRERSTQLYNEADDLLAIMSPQKLRAFPENEISAEGDLIRLVQRTGALTFRSTWDAGKGYALVELKEFGGEDLYWSGAWSDFRQVRGLWLPGTIEIKVWSAPGVPNFRKNYRLVEAEVNDGVSDLDLAGPVIPAGARLYDLNADSFVDDLTAVAERSLGSLRVESGATTPKTPSSPPPPGSAQTPPPAPAPTPVAQEPPLASPAAPAPPAPSRPVVPVFLLLAVLGIPAAILFLRRKNP